LGLKDTFGEEDLELAILREMESLIHPSGREGREKKSYCPALHQSSPPGNPRPVWASPTQEIMTFMKEMGQQVT